MKENKYDEQEFFEKYSQMDRSTKGLAGAGEWEALKEILPDFKGKDVLDLGCGFGWHCVYAVDKGASSVIGTDISEKMIEEARIRNAHPAITYRREAFEDSSFADDSFDIIICSLMIHYLESFEAYMDCVYRWLKPGGILVFTVEHPVFTAHGTQDWFYNENGDIRHFPVDRYFEEGKRDAVFLGEHVIKYHRTLTSYLDGLLVKGFELLRITEPKPSERLLKEVPGMEDELRRPMMLIVSARKK